MLCYHSRRYSQFKETKYILIIGKVYEYFWLVDSIILIAGYMQTGNAAPQYPFLPVSVGDIVWGRFASVDLAFNCFYGSSIPASWPGSVRRFESRPPAWPFYNRIIDVVECGCL